MKINKAVWNYIEYELYEYDATIEAIRELRDDIIYQIPLRETGTGISGGMTADGTADKAARLVTNSVLAHMSRTVGAIDRALARLDDTHRLLFELKYRRRMSWTEVCMNLAISDRAYFYKQKELILVAGQELGLVNVE